jgi:hypothetical protein
LKNLHFSRRKQRFLLKAKELGFEITVHADQFTPEVQELQLKWSKICRSFGSNH